MGKYYSFTQSFSTQFEFSGVRPCFGLSFFSYFTYPPMLQRWNHWQRCCLEFLPLSGKALAGKDIEKWPALICSLYMMDNLSTNLVTVFFCAAVVKADVDKIVSRQQDCWYTIWCTTCWGGALVGSNSYIGCDHNLKTWRERNRPRGNPQEGRLLGKLLPPKRQGCRNQQLAE